MKLLTKHSDYAVRALLYLAQHKGPFISTREIAQSDEIPIVFLRRIVQELVKSGLLKAKEGIAGGVMLARKPVEITLEEVISLFQGKIQFSECLFREKICCNRDQCVLRKRIQSIEKKVISEFRNITIQTLLNDLRIT